MKKVIHDGKVAVLISEGWGAGWYSWTNIEGLLYDPYIVDLVLKSEEDGYDRSGLIIEYCEQVYGSEVYFGGLDGLTVKWIPEGAKFRVLEEDGAERIEMFDDVEWMVA